MKFFVDISYTLGYVSALENFNFEWLYKIQIISESAEPILMNFSENITCILTIFGSKFY